MYRQGDVLVRAVEIPQDVRSLKDRPIILAHGEATGHAHTVAAPHVTLLEASQGERYLRITAEVDLEHQEHDTVTLPPGEYEVVRQREYTPERPRNVAD